ncbi:MAG: hypothetical protein HY710_11995, partial [Candidatus Latescibacteria bacterium]|nr:hypothetical protein [Candidatus Latescibacterota bacterium]
GGGGGGRGGGGGVPQLFFSRRVGRQLPDGSSVPIDLGLRLTGKLNRTTIGYLNVQTRETSYIDEEIADTTQVEPETNWQAFRLQQDILSRSSIGLLATFREPEGQPDRTSSVPVPRFAGRDYNRVLGMDAVFASSRSQHEFQFMMAKSWTDTVRASGSDWVWRVAQNWQNRWMSYNISYLDIGQNFIAQSGFVTRTDVRRVGGFVSLNPLIRKYGVRRLRPSVRGEYLASHDQRFFDPTTWEINPFLSFELEGGDFISLGGRRSFDTLTETTEVAGVHFQPGEYTYDQATFSVFTNTSRRLAWDVFSTIGEFYGGRLMSVSGEAQYRPVDRLVLSLGLTETRLKRPDRVGLASTEYDYNHSLIPRTRFSYSFTPNLFVTSLVQLNANKRRPGDDFHLNTVTSNFLIAYRSPFGHSFFIAFNQLSDDALSTTTTFGPYDRTPLRLRDRTIVAKMAYLFNM